MHPVEGRQPTVLLALHSVPANNSVPELELEKDRDSGEFKPNIPTNARLTFLF